ncbi:MAG: hypothetical protein IPL60_06445 [Ardenticatenia bacterium]|nr:hypothetical protein [Ardenticatenia bacterium]
MANRLWAGSLSGQWVGFIVSVDDQQGTFSSEFRVVSWTDGTLRQTVVGDRLGVEDLAGSNERRGVLTPVWSPDSRMIAFDTISAADDARPHSYDDLWMLEVGTGKITRVLDEGGGDIVFSPMDRCSPWRRPAISGDHPSVVKVCNRRFREPVRHLSPSRGW